MAAAAAASAAKSPRVATPPPPGPQSKRSGAAGRAKAKAVATASAAPPDLQALILKALPTFAGRGQRDFYRSMLRSAIEKLDLVKPKRSFSDREEWKTTLRRLASAGNIIYNEETDIISLPASNNSDEAEANEADEEQESREREQAAGFGSSSSSEDEDEI